MLRKKRPSELCLAAMIALGVLASAAAAQDTTKRADWSTFDAAKLVAEAKQKSNALRFERLWTSKNRMRLLHGLAISANGKRVLATTPRGEAVVYDGTSGKLVAKLSENASKACKAALSPDGSTAALGMLDGTVVTFDKTGKVLQRYMGPPAAPGRLTRVIGLQFTSDGKQIAWTIDGGIFSRAVLTEAKRNSRTVNPERQGIDLGVQSISPDGQILFTPSSDRKSNCFFSLAPPTDGGVRQFRLELGRAAWACTQSSNLIAYYTNVGHLIVQTHPRTRPENPSTPSQLTMLHLTPQTSDVRNMAISTDEKWLMVVGRGQVELRSPEFYETPSLHDADFEHASQVALAPDVLRIAVVDQDGHLAVLALPKPLYMPLWRFEKIVRGLARDEQYDHLEKIGELLQGESEPLPGSLKCLYDYFLDNALRRDKGPYADKQAKPEPEQIANWLRARPDSKVARLLWVQSLLREAWEARGSGFVNTVSEEGWEVFNRKVAEAHEQIKPLWKLENPPPGTFAYSMSIAKAEGWSHEQCMEQAERLMQTSPSHLISHHNLMQKFMMRWGGDADSSSNYAAWVGDTVGGNEGDVLYALLTMELVRYEDDELVRESLSIDFNRFWRGCAALQALDQWRPLGLLAEQRMAVALEDWQRVSKVAKIVEREKTPFVPGAFSSREYFERIYRITVDRPE